MSHDRRQFLGRLMGGVAATAGLPSLLRADLPPLSQVAREAGGLAPDEPGDEAFWRVVKDQFPLRPGLTLMNAANLCPSPYPVQKTVFELTRDIDGDASFHNRAKFDELREGARRGLARFLGADPDEIAITRNTSEGNNAVVNGIDLGPGDEVVLWDQNHPTNSTSWDVRAKRHGFTVKRVTTPQHPKSQDDYVAAFRDTLTPATRVLSFSHVSNVSGMALPAKELCAMARQRGILTLADGAQSFGCLQVDLHDIGCDFYTGSAHKWFLGPKEAGVLYVRRERAADLWASVVGVGWGSALEHGARKFETLGQRDDAAVSAVATAIEFHGTIGTDRIESRVRALASALKQQLHQRIPGVVIHTPMDPVLGDGGVVVFDLPGVDTREMYGTLYKAHGIAGAARSGDFPGIRLCPHIYNTMDDVERVVGVVGKMV